MHNCRQGAAETLSDVTFSVRQGSSVLASVFSLTYLSDLCNMSQGSVNRPVRCVQIEFATF